mgnify:CR=1 FL=1
MLQDCQDPLVYIRSDRENLFPLQYLNDYLSRESKYRIYLQGVNFSSPKNEYYPIPQEAIDRSFLEGEQTLTQDPNY